MVLGTVTTNLRFVGADRYLGIRHFGVFNEFSKKVKGEVDRYLLFLYCFSFQCSNCFTLLYIGN